MTEPIPVGPTGEQLSVEQQAAAVVTAELRSQLRTAAARIIALYVGVAGGTDRDIPPHLRREFAQAAGRIIAQVHADIRLQLWEMVLQALRAGQASALPFIDTLFADLRTYSQMSYEQVLAQAQRPPQTVADWIVQVVAITQARLNAQLLSASAAPTAGPLPQSFDQVMSWITQAEAALSGLERDTRWATNAAFNQAAREVADTARTSRMWIAERDACLHCLALSGTIAAPGEPFNASLTFYVGPEGLLKPLPVYPIGPLWGPPRHPNCRCFVRPTPVLAGYPLMPWEAPPPYTPAQALQREARRAVLRGTSGTESLPARLRAVDALLALGAGDVPRSVQQRARRAVAAGRFGT